MCERHERDEEEGVWQREEARCAVVLHEVFRWLSARDVCAAGGACSAWRRAAAAPALWRHLLRRDAGLAARDLRALALAPAAHTDTVCWREEYVRTFARWERCEVVGCGGSAVHAALDPAGGTRLAVLTGDDATLTVWQYPRSRVEKKSEWVAMWTCGLRERAGWAGVARVQWAGSRLLLAGPLALAPGWELLVIQLDGQGVGRVLSRARCGGGGAGCWADAAGEVFLSLELAVFAPGVAATTVWLNSASQETQSEHAGVRAPLYRIYNESGEHFTQALVVECPADDDASSAGTDPTADLHFYLNAIRQQEEDPEEEDVVKMRVLVTTSGCGRGDGGGLASAWGVTAARPPALSAAEHGGDLRERARRAAAAVPPAAPAVPPAEHEVRALCTPPDDTCALPAPVVGLTPHRSGRCLWVTLSSGEPWCLSLPTLRPLRRLTPSSPSPSSPLSSHYLYYVQPSVSDCFLASPMPARGAVGVWSALGGGAAPADRLPALPAPPVQALLLPAGDTLLVLVADTIHTFRPSSSSSIRKVWAREASKSCTGTETPAPTPCPPKPRPPCRPPPPSAARSAVRVACCPPPRGRRPPCPVPPRPDPLTCANQRQSVRVSHPGVVCEPSDGAGGCGASQDRVARRLAAAEAARRADYEHEARCAATDGSHGATCAPFSLGAERHCARATDGQMYTLPCAQDPMPPCGPCREPPPPRAVSIQPDDACKVTAQRHVDPCAHRPRKFVEIARGKNEMPPGSDPAPDRSLASRIINGLTAGGGRKCTPPPQGGRGRCGLHTSAAEMARAGAAPDASSRGIDEVLRERATFKEAGRGRVAGCEAGEALRPPPVPPGAQLDLAVPPHAARVTVSVTVHEGPTSCAAPQPRPPSSALRAAAPKAPASCPSNAERRDSWLSFKSIQQKFSNKRPEPGPRDGADGCGKPKPSCPAKPPCPPPCPPPTPPPPPPPPKHPYPRHPCPPRPTCPPPKTTQPSKDKKGDSGCNITTEYLPLTVV